MKDISTTLDDAEIDEVYLGDARFKQNKSLADEHQTECKKQRPRFKFSMVNIPIGATITFVPTGLDVKVADELLYIKDKNGVIIKVQRPVNRKKDAGISNVEDMNVDYTITITTDISDMFEDLYKIAKDIYENKDTKIHYGQDSGVLPCSD